MHIVRPEKKSLLGQKSMNQELSNGVLALKVEISQKKLQICSPYLFQTILTPLKRQIALFYALE